MKNAFFRCCLCLTLMGQLLLFSFSSYADELEKEMETENARWLDAFNNKKFSETENLYTKDALLFPLGLPPVRGPAEIAKLWETNIKRGTRDHTFKIISIGSDGKLAYQVASWTVRRVNDKGDVTAGNGNSVRIFERQKDGAWKIKIHLVNRPSP